MTERDYIAVENLCDLRMADTRLRSVLPSGQGIDERKLMEAIRLVQSLVKMADVAVGKLETA